MSEIFDASGDVDCCAPVEDCEEGEGDGEGQENVQDDLWCYRHFVGRAEGALRSRMAE